MNDLQLENELLEVTEQNVHTPIPTNPFFSHDFAKTYERTGNRVMAPVGFEALRLTEGLVRGKKILDIGAGAGSLSVPAAYCGANLTAVDFAPGMVDLLSERLSAFPNATVKCMDGQSLAFDDDSFDIAFSIMATPFFENWRKGLSEQYRVVRNGGSACVAVWKTLPGGGPFLIMARAMKSAFPHNPPPPAPDGFVTLSDESRLNTAMTEAGFDEVQVTEFEAVWHGPTGEEYLREMRGLHSYMLPYRTLSVSDQAKVDHAILAILGEYTSHEQIIIRTPMLIAIGQKQQ